MDSTVKYSESETESAKKESVLVPIENKYKNELSQPQDVQELEDEESDGDLEPEYFYGYRGKQVLKAAGKNGGGSKRPPKRKAETADDEGDEEEGENAKEGGK